jgi:hypothetical protein
MKNECTENENTYDSFMNKEWSKNESMQNLKKMQVSQQNETKI